MKKGRLPHERDEKVLIQLSKLDYLPLVPGFKCSCKMKQTYHALCCCGERTILIILGCPFPKITEWALRFHFFCNVVTVSMLCVCFCCLCLLCCFLPIVPTHTHTASEREFLNFFTKAGRQHSQSVARVLYRYSTITPYCTVNHLQMGNSF